MAAAGKLFLTILPKKVESASLGVGKSEIPVKPRKCHCLNIKKVCSTASSYQFAFANQVINARLNLGGNTRKDLLINFLSNMRFFLLLLNALRPR